MKPVEFKGQNCVLQRPQGMSQAECGPLPVFRDGRYCISCWRPGWRDRLAVLFGRPLWLWVWSGGTQPPVSVSTLHPFLEVKKR